MEEVASPRCTSSQKPLACRASGEVRSFGREGSRGRARVSKRKPLFGDRSSGAARVVKKKVSRSGAKFERSFESLKGMAGEGGSSALGLGVRFRRSDAPFSFAEPR